MWARALCAALNHNPAYQKAARQWEGDVLLVMRLSEHPDANRSPAPFYAVYLDLHHGQCRQARPGSSADLENADYVLEAPVEVWKSLLDGNIDPLPAMMRGKLKLKKGKLSILAKFAPAAKEIVASARTLEASFPAP
ncbi:MAG: Fis family transcriptional regulator [Bacteroidetes bacterium]|nr:MAG: Fis family transcriptional regulator [Bacteroidota bacterium]